MKGALSAVGGGTLVQAISDKVVTDLATELENHNMALSLGGTAISTNIVNGGGKYAFKRERLRTNGDAEAVMSNYYTLTWTFEQMPLTDFTWIRSTLMSGAGSVKYSSATLYNDLGVLKPATPTPSPMSQPGTQLAAARCSA
jgi:hypothetical protein